MTLQKARATPRKTDGRQIRWVVLLAAIGLAGCGRAMPTQTIAPAQTIAPGPGNAGPSIPVAIDSSRMTASVRAIDGAPCVGLVFPIDGRAAFDAAVQAAASGPVPSGIHRVAVRGEQLTYSYGAGPAMLGQVMLAPTATIVTRVRVDTDFGRSETTINANGTGRRSYNDFVGCAALGEALADAYREALRDLSNQVADHIMQVGWTVAGVPPFR